MWYSYQASGIGVVQGSDDSITVVCSTYSSV